MADPLAALPLGSIRVFEAAARLSSFTRAAAELGMTQAAVSWQVKALERRLGQTLFRRLPREVVLTAAGERLFTAATEAMGLLRRAVIDLSESDQAVLSITTLQTFATQWLAPRLGAFQLANPSLAVRVDTSPRLYDLIKDDVDVALRAGSGHWPGLESVFLMPGEFTPLCTPEVRARCGGLDAPEQLLTAPLIGAQAEWTAWFAAAGVVENGRAEVPRLVADNQLLEMAAALGGQGVALGSPILFGREIADGRLIRLFGPTISLSPGYWLVYPEERRRSPKIARFRAWLIDALAADPAVAAAAGADSGGA